jgi:uncharacterized phage infection (PIP) family protein YhgE
VVGVKTYTVLLAALSAFSTLSCAQDSSGLLGGIEDRVGLILLIGEVVIIVLMVLMLFYMHSIAEHLNWIRRIR